jgi:hypothetical protein
MRYQIEGQDENGQWNWSHVSADGIEDNTIFDDRRDAKNMANHLAVNVYRCSRDDIRVVEIDDARNRVHEAYRNAVMHQGFTGTLADWKALSARQRHEYELGTARIPTG